jgi:hypothetical protein
VVFSLLATLNASPVFIAERRLFCVQKLSNYRTGKGIRRLRQTAKRREKRHLGRVEARYARRRSPQSAMIVFSCLWNY